MKGRERESYLVAFQRCVVVPVVFVAQHAKLGSLHVEGVSWKIGVLLARLREEERRICTGRDTEKGFWSEAL